MIAMKGGDEGLACGHKLSGSLFDLKNDSADDIVVAIVGNVKPHKADAIAKGLLAQLKHKQQRPAG
jgi:hypothetical protein